MPKQVALDVETTGLDFAADRITEIAVVPIGTFEPLPFSTRLHPDGRPIPASVTKITGLTDADVAEAPRFVEIVDQLEEAIGDSDVIAFHAAFDEGMLRAEYARIHRPYPFRTFLCAREQARGRVKLTRLTLDTVARALGIDGRAGRKHGALIDARICARMWDALAVNPELGLATPATVRAAPQTITIPRFGEPARPIIGTVTSHYTLNQSAVRPRELGDALGATGWTGAVLGDQATTAGHVPFAANCDGIIAAVTFEFAGSRMIVTALADGQGGLTAVNRIASAAADKGALSPADILAAIDPMPEKTGLMFAASRQSDHSMLQIIVPQFARAGARVAINISDPNAEATTIGSLASLSAETSAPIVFAPNIAAVTAEGLITRQLLAASAGLAAPAAIALPTPAEFETMGSFAPGAVQNLYSWLSAFTPAALNRQLTIPSHGSAPQSLAAMATTGLNDMAARGRLSPLFKRKSYDDRLQYELSAITSAGFENYFLIVADIVSAAKRSGIPVGPGRGSGAGSLVAFTIGITAVDPLAHGLIFERFLNPARATMPDFDIDFCERRRSDVIAALAGRYGAAHVAGLSAYTEARAKGAWRASARLEAVPQQIVDRVSKMLPEDGLPRTGTFEPALADVVAGDASAARAMENAQRIEGFIRSRSRHAAAVVISDAPVTDIAGSSLDARSGERVLFADKDGAETLGLVKFDLLGLTTLTTIDRALRLIAGDADRIDPWGLPLDDQRTLDLLDSGRGAGVFQLESAGMQAAARRLGIARFADLVALIALYRPGPMAEIDRIADRKRGLEPALAPHPVLQESLEETYGVIIYQEQVMEAARIAAGFSLAEADLLRRAMAKKNAADMSGHRGRFAEGFVRLGHGSETDAHALFDTIDKFAGYGFNKSHAAAYALIAYATAYIKAHHPTEYLAACMDSRAGDGEGLSALAAEARRLNIGLLTPCANLSDVESKPEHVQTGHAIRLGLGLIRDLGQEAARLITPTRPYQSISQMASALQGNLGERAIERLAGAGALDCFYQDRGAAIGHCVSEWQAAALEARNAARGQTSLFDMAKGSDNPKSAASSATPADIAAAEQAALGFIVGRHPTESAARLAATTGSILLSEATATRFQSPVSAVVLIERSERRAGTASLALTISDASARSELRLAADAPGAVLAEPGAIAIAWLSRDNNGRLRIGALEALPKEESGQRTTVRVVIDDSLRRDAVQNSLRGLAEGLGYIEIMNQKGQIVDRSPHAIVDPVQAAKVLRTVPGVIDVLCEELSS